MNLVLGRFRITEGTKEKTAGKVLQEEGLGRRVPGESAESETGPYQKPNVPRRITYRDICKYLYCKPLKEARYGTGAPFFFLHLRSAMPS